MKDLQKTNYMKRSIIRLNGLLLLIFSLSLCSSNIALAQEAEVSASVNEESASQETVSPESPTDEFNRLAKEMTQGSLPKRGQAIKKLSALNDLRVISLFEALQDGKLYANKSPDPVIAIAGENDTFTDALTGNLIAADQTESLKRIPINNTMRVQLRGMVAQLNLNHLDANVRNLAIQRMMTDGIDEDTKILLEERIKHEPDTDVRNRLGLAIALANLQNEQKQIRLDAIKILEGALEQEIRSALNSVAENDADSEVRTAAFLALESIEDRISTYRVVENVFFGLSLGSVLLLSAIGLAITFGVMGVINMAHGELMMIGAYVTWGVQMIFPNQITYSLLIAIPAAFVVAGLVGVAIERGVIQFLYGRPLETLLATFGISLILQQVVRTFISPNNQAVQLPDWMSGSISLNPVLSITNNRLFIFIFALMVFFALLLILKKTSLGLKVRAVSQNRNMARAVGVKANWVDAMTFGLGSGIAGIAGVALSQLTNVGPNLGQSYIIDSFMVVVLGGVGNLWGTLVGAMSLGILNKFMEPFAGAVLAKVVVLVLLILFIQKKPKGLFPQKGRAAAD
jgi:urea transport system permease protein